MIKAVVIALSLLLFSAVANAKMFEVRQGDVSTKQDVQLFLKQDQITRLATGVCSGTAIDFVSNGKRAGGLFSGCGFASAAVTGQEPDFSGAIGVGADIMGIKIFGGRDPVRSKWTAGLGFSLVGGVIDQLTAPGLPNAPAK